MHVKSKAAVRKFAELCELYDAECRMAVSQGCHRSALISIEDRLWEFTQQMCALATMLDQPEIETVQVHHFRPKVLKWCQMHPAIAALWSKPSGYSGDFRTIELICENRRSQNTFTDVFANHLLRSKMAEQHRAKVAEQATFIVRALHRPNHPVNILSAGAGSAFDVRAAISSLTPKETDSFTLLDLDHDALSFSSQELLSVSPTLNLSLVKDDVLRGIRGLLTLGHAASFDAILFGGLFDYLPDRVVVMVLKTARRLLKKDGRILFSQVSPDNPDRVFMEWFGDWKIIQRDETCLKQLCECAGYRNSDFRFWREASGIAILGELQNDNAEQQGDRSLFAAEVPKPVVSTTRAAEAES